MADMNNRKRDGNETGESGRNNVGVVPGDTYASALDPFGSVAGVDAGGTSVNKEKKGTDDDCNYDSITKDWN